MLADLSRAGAIGSEVAVEVDERSRNTKREKLKSASAEENIFIDPNKMDAPFGDCK